jgi:hypothetical protein
MTTPQANSVLLATLVLLTSIFAHGQHVESRPIANSSSPEMPMFKVYQAVFSLLFPSHASLSSEDTKRNVIAFFKTIGLDDKSAIVLFPYVRQGLADQEKYTERKVVQLCKDRASIKSKRQIGDTFATINSELYRMQQRRWGSLEFLDAKNREILADYATKRGSQIQFSQTDPRAVFEKSPEPLGQMIERICRGK